MALTAYADADHTGCQDTQRSTSDSAQFLGDKLVSWSSKKQTSMSISFTEAEYIAMTVTIADVNVNAPEVPSAADAPPTRSDEQILPRDKWVPVGKSNCFLDVERTQTKYHIQGDIDYVERIWGRRCTQCIHSFIEAQDESWTIHEEGKKKVNPLVIPGVRFTKLVRMTIPNTLITEDLRMLPIIRNTVAKGAIESACLGEPDSRKLQPLPEVQGKGKEKVGEEQAAQVLLNLQTPKKKNPAEQFIFQRHTPATADPFGLVESSSLYAELGLTDSGTESDEEVSPEMNAQGYFTLHDQFLCQQKSQEDEPENTNTEAEVQYMATVPILQDTSSVPLMTTPVIDITDPQSDSTTTSDSEFRDSQEIDRKIEESVKEVVTASVQHAMRAPLCTRFKDLPTSDMKEILLQRMLEGIWEKGHEDHKMAYEALQKSITRDESEKFNADKAEERTKKKRASGTIGASDSAQDSPPPPPSSTTNRGDQSQSSAAPGSSKTTASTKYTAWTTTTSRLKPAASSVPEDVLMHEESDFEAQDMGFDDEDSGSRHIPKFCKKQGITELTPEHLEGPAYEVVKSFHPDVIHLQFQMEECHKLLTNQVDEGLLRYDVSIPLPLGGPPGQGDRLALSITKMKAASYPDAKLEQMVPDQMWAEEEYMYDILASFGISYWWFKRQQFYIDRHSADTNRRAIVRTHMRILSVVRIEVFSLYRYDYMKKIVLQRADNQGNITIVKATLRSCSRVTLKDSDLAIRKGRRLTARHRELPDSDEPHQTLPRSLQVSGVYARLQIL
ncbi:retrovirus-related pol polyprotein from transposon TNT 1-94 [Tanacetum coccineum]